uniref:Putative immunoglobulin heavy chain variable region n=1 Tax=Ixodes ricinus TaxID=34613 RepID=A0A6B0USR8_IXORI
MPRWRSCSSSVVLTSRRPTSASARPCTWPRCATTIARRWCRCCSRTAPTWTGAMPTETSRTACWQALASASSIHCNTSRCAAWQLVRSLSARSPTWARYPCRSRALCASTEAPVDATLWNVFFMTRRFWSLWTLF